MSIQRFSGIIVLILLFALALAGCDAVGQVQQAVEQVKAAVLPSPTPLPTPTPEPYVGQVGQRTAYNGWAVTVTNVMRSDLNPQEITPKQGYINDEYDYISMDVVLERTVDERGRVDGLDFELVDKAGNVYRENTMRNWEYANDEFYLDDTGADRIAFYLPRTAQDLTLQFSPYPAMPEPVEVALNEAGKVRRIDLQEAIELGLLTADVTGVSLDSIVVDVSLEVEDSVELSIAPGTTFLAPSPDLQTMMVRRQVFIFLEEKDEVSLKVSVACANMRLEAPSGGETYIVRIEPPAEEMRKLMGLEEFQGASFRLQQFAIWTFTDKPGRGQYVGLSTGGGQGSAPSNKELDTIASWFEAAGLALSDYPALRK